MISPETWVKQSIEYENTATLEATLTSIIYHNIEDTLQIDKD